MNSNATVVYNGKTTNANITGVTPEYESVQTGAYPQAAGLLPEQDNQDIAMVVVLGQSVIQNIFGSSLVSESHRAAWCG